jgi:hypothetical protein
MVALVVNKRALLVDKCALLFEKSIRFLATSPPSANAMAAGSAPAPDASAPAS